MAYYPNNFYQNYPYPSPINNLQGKVVDGIDAVKASEVPFGGFCVFPKGDFSEVYIKNWNNNGLTQITRYKPFIEEKNEEKPIITNDTLLERLEAIENKINDFIEKDKPQKPVNNTAKEVNVNAYKL